MPTRRKRRHSRRDDSVCRDERCPSRSTGYRIMQSGAVPHRPKLAARVLRIYRRADASAAARMQARRATTRGRWPDLLRRSGARKWQRSRRYLAPEGTRKAQLKHRVQTASATNVAQQFSNGPARLRRLRAHGSKPFCARAFARPRTDDRRRTDQRNSRCD